MSTTILRCHAGACTMRLTASAPVPVRDARSLARREGWLTVIHEDDIVWDFCPTHQYDKEMIKMRAKVTATVRAAVREEWTIDVPDGIGEDEIRDRFDSGSFVFISAENTDVWDEQDRDVTGVEVVEEYVPTGLDAPRYIPQPDVFAEATHAALSVDYLCPIHPGHTVVRGHCTENVR